MQKAYRFGLIICIALLILLAGCARRHYLMIDYRVPQAMSTPLKGQKVRLAIKDVRKNNNIMSPGAAEIFPEFKDRYGLTLVTLNNQRTWSGVYRLTDLLSRAIKKRLELLGAEVVDHADSTFPLLTVSLKKLNLDQQGVMWYTALTCEAALKSKDGHEAKETVTGKAERARVVGRKGADKLLSQIFSDALNRIDMVKLFKNAKLI